MEKELSVEEKEVELTRAIIDKELSSVLNSKFLGRAYTASKKKEIEIETRRIVDQYIASDVEYEVILPETSDKILESLVVSIRRKE